MAQTTQITIDNQTFPSFRSKLNESLSALNTLNSGTSRPSSAVAGTIWLDTTNATNPTLKFYDGADDISLATIDYSANTVNWLDSSVSLTSPVEISGNSTSGAEIRLPEDTDNGSHYVGLKASDSIASNITFTLPNADGTCGQAIVTDGCGNLSFASVEGRTGTVNWDTTAKTASFTAVSGNGYFVNTTSGAITVTLPAGSAGSIVSLKDYANTWNTNNVTVTPNGTDKINGTNASATLNTQDQSVTLVYVDSTKGWRVVQDSTSDVTGASFIVATGGTITCCGDYKIHTFTGPGTFTVCSVSGTPANNVVDYLVVGGGAGGGAGAPNWTHGGGGGAGGYRTFVSNPTTSPKNAPAGITVTATSFPVTVGGGGAGGTPPTTTSQGASGSVSTFSSVTSAGGGGGGGYSIPNCQGASAGGSGGGGGNASTSPGICGGAGNTPPVSPPQGNTGGDANRAFVGPTYYENFAGGGGGANAVGGNGGPASPAANSRGGTGGAGEPNYITGSNVTYAGGGGGGGSGITDGGTPLPNAGGGPGGTGGGGVGMTAGRTENSIPWSPGSTGGAGTANTGGGGGGGAATGDSVSPEFGTNGGNGGSGIVIIRYKYQ